MNLHPDSRKPRVTNPKSIDQSVAAAASSARSGGEKREPFKSYVSFESLSFLHAPSKTDRHRYGQFLAVTKSFWRCKQNEIKNEARKKIRPAARTKIGSTE